MSHLTEDDLNGTGLAILTVIGCQVMGIEDFIAPGQRRLTGPEACQLLQRAAAEIERRRNDGIGCIQDLEPGAAFTLAFGGE